MKDKNMELMEKINKRGLGFGGLIMALSYFPQIIQILRTKTSEGISLIFISMVAFALITFSFNGYIVYKKTGDKGTLLSQLANLIPALILILLIVVFR